jgi:hypothetical protein
MNDEHSVFHQITLRNTKAKHNVVISADKLKYAGFRTASL